MNTKSLSVLAIPLLFLTGAASAVVIFDATNVNTTVITNNGTPTGVEDTSGALTYTGATNSFNNSGITSTDNINTLIGGAGLTEADTVTITLDVSSITGGALRSQGVYFGMSGDNSTILGGSNSMLIQMEGSNIGSDIMIPTASFQDTGDTGLQNFNNAILQGFTATLTADKDGYEFSLTGVHTTSPLTVSGSFSGTEFVDNFGTGHFYYAAQKYNQATPLVTNITEASISVVPEPSTYALLAGLSALLSVMIRRRES